MHKHLTMPTFGISQWLTTTPEQKIMVLHQNSCYTSWYFMCYCIIFKKDRELLLRSNYWAWREGRECALYSPPLDPPQSLIRTLHVVSRVSLLHCMLTMSCLINAVSPLAVRKSRRNNFRIHLQITAVPADIIEFNILSLHIFGGLPY